MRTIFQNEEHNQRFDRDGYVVLQVLDASEIERIKKFYHENSDPSSSGFHTSLQINSPEQQEKIHQFLSRTFDEFLSPFFQNYKPILSNFVVKNTDTDSTVNLHQDFTFVDEAAYTSLNLWLPLCDTNTDNGALGVFKGSHRLKPNLRGTGMPRGLSIPHEMISQYMTYLLMKIGEVVVFDHRLIHGSQSNRFANLRVAASISIVPAEATPKHYAGQESEGHFAAGTSRLLELDVDEEFYYQYHVKKSVPGTPPVAHLADLQKYRCREIEYQTVVIDEQDIRRLYNADSSMTTKSPALNFLRKMKHSVKSVVGLKKPS